MRRLAVPIALTACAILCAADGENARAPARAPLDRAPDGPRPGEPEADGLVPQGADALPGKASTALPIQGVVLDPDGDPVAGATVLFEFGHVGRGRGCFAQGMRDGEARATTDGAGVFALAAPASARWAVVNVDADGWAEPAPRVASFGSGTVVIRAPRSEAWRRVAASPLPDDCDRIPADARAMGLLAGEAWPRMRIVLERGERIEGTVLTGAGAPVPGAAVTARWQDGLPGWRTLGASADACGRFSMLVPAVAVLTAASVETVGSRVLAKDAQAWAWPVAPGTSDLRLVLVDQVALDLDVRNAPIPMEFAWVGATPVGFPGPCDWLVRVGRLHTDTEGDAVRVVGLLPGISDLVIHPPGRNYMAAPARVSAPGARAVVEWPRVIPVDGILEGEDVEDFDVTWTGKAPADGSTVVRIGVDAWPPGLLLVDPPGRFRLYASGPGTICARRAGDPRCAWAPAFDRSSGLLRLSVATGREIRGSAEGRPGMNLSALRVRAVAGALSEVAAVNDDGSFAIVGLPPVAFRVELRSGEWVHDAIDGVPAGAEGLRLHVRLPVTDPDRGS